jgi:hypothetical protein
MPLQHLTPPFCHQLLVVMILLIDSRMPSTIQRYSCISVKQHLKKLLLVLMSTTLGNENSVKWSYYSIHYFNPKKARKTTTYNKRNIPDISSLHSHTVLTA